jgi:hypothetical protein
MAFGVVATREKSKLITQVPRLLQALRRVDIGERLLERLVVRARQAVLVEVVAGGYDEVDAELLPDPAHLHMGKAVAVQLSSPSTSSSSAFAWVVVQLSACAVCAVCTTTRHHHQQEHMYSFGLLVVV